MKQETLEKVAENYGWSIKRNIFSDPIKANELAESSKQDFIEGAKWQQERQDKFAIEFGYWVGKNTITYNNGKFRMKTLTPIFLTSEELLEIFKKEKGL